MTSHYLNQPGMAKVSHVPEYQRQAGHNYVIYILPRMAWEPMLVTELRFPSRNDAEMYLEAVYDQVDLVKERVFDALCANLRVLPKNFLNCH